MCIDKLKYASNVTLYMEHSKTDHSSHLMHPIESNKNLPKMLRVDIYARRSDIAKRPPEQNHRNRCLRLTNCSFLAE